MGNGDPLRILFFPPVQEVWLVDQLEDFLALRRSSLQGGRVGGAARAGLEEVVLMLNAICCQHMSEPGGWRSLIMQQRGNL